MCGKFHQLWDTLYVLEEMGHPVSLLSRKKAAARWGTLARCFAARRLPKTELSTVVLPHVTQSFPKGVPRELAEISQFEDKGRNSILLKNIKKIRKEILTNFLSKSYKKSEEISTESVNRSVPRFCQKQACQRSPTWSTTRSMVYKKHI